MVGSVKVPDSQVRSRASPDVPSIISAVTVLECDRRRSDDDFGKVLLLSSVSRPLLVFGEQEPDVTLVEPHEYVYSLWRNYKSKGCRRKRKRVRRAPTISLIPPMRQQPLLHYLLVAESLDGSSVVIVVGDKIVHAFKVRELAELVWVAEGVQ